MVVLEIAKVFTADLLRNLFLCKVISIRRTFKYIQETLTISVDETCTLII